MESLILKKTFTTIAIASIIAVVSACGSDSETKVGGGSPEDPIFIGEAVEDREQATEFSHIHGLSKHPNDNNKILLASHTGLIEYDIASKEAHFVGDQRFDLMGYSHIPGSQILMTSGHPDEESSLPNPLGFLLSDDFGETWEVRGYHAMVDFHALSATKDKSKILGHGSNAGKNVIMESYDQGYTWDIVKSKGLPLSHDDFYGLSVAPNNGDIAFAATNQGLLYTSNGGADWEISMEGYITAISVIGDDEVVFYEASKTGLFRMKGEEMFSYDLYLGTDAINYLVVGDDPSEVTVTTFENNVLVTTDHGKNWETLLEKGNFPE